LAETVVAAESIASPRARRSRRCRSWTLIEFRPQRPEMNEASYYEQNLNSAIPPKLSNGHCSVIQSADPDSFAFASRLKTREKTNAAHHPMTEYTSMLAPAISP
jgi:hypothetical protein